MAKGGCGIKDVQQTSGARCHVNFESNEITVHGTQEQIAVAVKLIQDYPRQKNWVAQQQQNTSIEEDLEKQLRVSKKLHATLYIGLFFDTNDANSTSRQNRDYSSRVAELSASEREENVTAFFEDVVFPKIEEAGFSGGKDVASGSQATNMTRVRDSVWRPQCKYHITLHSLEGKGHAVPVTKGADALVQRMKESGEGSKLVEGRFMLPELRQNPALTSSLDGLLRRETENSGRAVFRVEFTHFAFNERVACLIAKLPPGTYCENASEDDGCAHVIMLIALNRQPANGEIAQAQEGFALLSDIQTGSSTAHVVTEEMMRYFADDGSLSFSPMRVWRMRWREHSIIEDCAAQIESARYGETKLSVIAEPPPPTAAAN
jgi:hypothetical protein